MSLREEDVKEAMEFMTRFGGSIVSIGENMLLDWINQNYPTNPLNAQPAAGLPQWSTILASLGFNVAPWVLAFLTEDDAIKRGDTKAKETARTGRQIFEGGVLYTLPRMARITAVHTITPP